VATLTLNRDALRTNFAELEHRIGTELPRV